MRQSYLELDPLPDNSPSTWEVLDLDERYPTHTFVLGGVVRGRVFDRSDGLADGELLMSEGGETELFDVYTRPKALATAGTKQAVAALARCVERI
jgi:hypothetical protein